MNTKQLVIVVTLAICAIGLSELAASAKPDQPRGRTENAPGKLTVLTNGNGLTEDHISNVYVDHQVDGSADCLLLVVPARDGVDQGRVTMFHRLPDGVECSSVNGAENRSFGVSSTAYDLDGSGDVIAGPEYGLMGQFRCFDIFTDDTSDASCRFLIREDGNGPIRWVIEWPSVAVSGDGDLRGVTNVGNAEIYKVVEAASNGNSGKTKTESQLQDEESIPLAIEVERLSY